MSRLLNHVKGKIEERRNANQHDFVGEVAPSRLNATRTSFDQGHRRNRSSGSPTPSFGATHSLRRSNSQTTLGLATAGADALDLEIKFISAQDLPRMDVVGVGCDPYFRVEIDGAISYT
jgi:hypothetical protein